MKQVTVIGGGFSGLVTSYYLARQGVPVTLVEKRDRLGGLIDTIRTPHGPVEAAASGIRSNARLESLCRELGVPLVETKPESRKRYLYRGGPRQWPLGPVESAGMAARLVSQLTTGRFRPLAGETIETWGARVIGPTATRNVLGAALQGIYAGDPSRMSASLVFGKKEKPPKGELKGLVAPPVGLVELIEALGNSLESMGVDVRMSTEADADAGGAVVICTSARDAAGLMRRRSAETAEALDSIEMVPLLRVTAFYPESENTIEGFGILFPREQGIRALGVLINTNIFPNRGEGHSESWIYGGAQDRQILDLDDEGLFEVMDRDRERLYGRRSEPLSRYPQRWPVGLPHYDLELEKLLGRGIPIPRDVYLGGNYLRGIGLPMLLEHGYHLAQRIHDEIAS